LYDKKMLIENLKDKMLYKLQRAMINESYDVNDIYAFVRRCLYTNQLLRDIEEKTRFRNKQAYQLEKTMSQLNFISAFATVSILSRIIKIVTFFTQTMTSDQSNSFSC
jgi:hypothetical protein